MEINRSNYIATDEIRKAKKIRHIPKRNIYIKKRRLSRQLPKHVQKDMKCVDRSSSLTIRDI